MKKILLATILLAPFITFADSSNANDNSQQNNQQQQRFEARKAKITERMQNRITKMQQKLDKMQQAKSCIDKATTKDTMKACKPE
ncbi:hypothetical protein [Francisella sp. 19X1-34]|uniref:hypothetical protein n=1 Tax=Francisella sp. 19X1-34 TaxID=3087177 RepID=UPI002E2FBED7|nr:hypothetical protein [Francisella sp. 19X1-34]MED7787759.1 hypothetical protein [Francisella sp. 19X1-34]